MRHGYVFIYARKGDVPSVLESLTGIPTVREAYCMEGPCSIHVTLEVKTAEQLKMTARQIAKIDGVGHTEGHFPESGFCIENGKPVYVEPARRRE